MIDLLNPIVATGSLIAAVLSGLSYGYSLRTKKVLSSLNARQLKLKGALRFYATGANWLRPTGKKADGSKTWASSRIAEDRGATAREALADD